LFARVLPLQKSVNAVESAIVNTALSYAVPSYLVSTDSGVDPSDLARVAGAPGVVIPVEGSVDQAVRALNQGKVVDEELLGIKQQMEATIYKICGVSAEFQGTFGTAGNTRGGAAEASNRSRIVEQKFFQNLQEYIEDLTEIFVDFIKNKFSGQKLYTRGKKTSAGQYSFQTTDIPEQTRNVDYTFTVNLDVKTQYSKQASKELVKELYQIERQYDAPVKVINIKDIISNYDIPNQEELVKRYDDLTKRENDRTSELIAGLMAQAVLANVPQELLQQGISEILEGKQTPTVDQILQMIEQFLAQQQQMEQQQAEMAQQQPAPQPGAEQMGQAPQPGLEQMLAQGGGGDIGDQILDLAGAEGAETGDIGDQPINLA
jgi:hypothetical protein